MSFWLDMEGNGTGKGFISVSAQNIATGVVSTIYRTQTYGFPSNMFGYTRHIVSFNGLTNTFRVLLTGIQIRLAVTIDQSLTLVDYI